jgi:hypothetical protein
LSAGSVAARCRRVGSGLIVAVAVIAFLFAGPVLAEVAPAATTGIAPAFRSVLNSGSDVTFSWSPPSIENYPGIETNGIGLVITENIGFFSGTRCEPEEVLCKQQVVVVPIKPGQTSLTLPFSLPAGVVLYWAIDQYLAPGGEISDTPVVGDDGSPFAFGITNPVTAHDAKTYIGRVIEYYVAHPARFNPSVKCSSPVHGRLRCQFKGRNSAGVTHGTAVLSTGSGPFVSFAISGTLATVYGAPGEGEHTVRRPFDFHGIEAQVCSAEGLPLEPVGTTPSGVGDFFCKSTEVPIQQ